MMTELPWNSKIQARHLSRLAIVYVRQSTSQQIERHAESTKLQYALTDRALQLGWAQTRLLVIDRDLGLSGTSAEARPGFQQLMAEVGLDHVGIVFGIDMSRLARSCRDWHQLLEVCALFGTLIGDADGVYDPGTYNDRLLLGLKGTMSEAELHILKQRMLEGKRAKARRGELGMQVPMGYVRHPSGEIQKDPDEQAQSTIQLAFSLFEKFGTIYAVLRYFVRHQIQMPYRYSFGIRSGELEWRRPNRPTLCNLFHNPIYAGAYVYGRRPVDSRRKKPGRPSTGRRVAESGAWEVLIKDHLPAYIPWEQFECNLKQLKKNRTLHEGVSRHGPSLLSGLLICGHCGRRMNTHYTNNGLGLRYACMGLADSYALPLCQSLKGDPLDALIVQWIFKVLKPAALEVSLKVSEDLEAERQTEETHWKKRLERAAYTAARAYRQYNAAEPENRLVVRSLEHAWEEALAQEAALKNEYARATSQKPLPLSAQEREGIRRLAKDIPALWNAPTTKNIDRQAIVRGLIDKIMITVQGNTEKVDVLIHWAGGWESRVDLVRPVAALQQLSYYTALIERVQALKVRGKTYVQIAEALNREGWHPAKKGSVFTTHMINSLLNKGPSTLIKKQQVIDREIHEWTLQELARKLEIPSQTLYAWLRKDLLKARQSQTEQKRLTWLVHADELEMKRLKKLHTTPKHSSFYGLQQNEV